MKKSTPEKSMKKVNKAPSVKPPVDARELSAEFDTRRYMISNAVIQVSTALAKVERGATDWLDQLTVEFSALDEIREQAEGMGSDIEQILIHV